MRYNTKDSLLNPEFMAVDIDTAAPWYAGRLRSMQVASMSTGRGPDEATYERAIMEARGIKSTLAVPFAVGGEFRGAIVINTMRQENEWSDAYVRRLQLVGEVFGAAVARRKAEAELRETERDYARELLGQVEVKAPQDGLLLYTDRADWIGRPVVVGERIMEIANPLQVEVRIDLPVSDAIVLAEGAPVKVFLNANPLDSLGATVSHASYHAEVLPGDLLAYRVKADLNGSADEVRIGWQGTAKIYGEDVSLFFLLFRRPISAARQFLGL